MEMSKLLAVPLSFMFRRERPASKDFHLCGGFEGAALSQSDRKTVPPAFLPLRDPAAGRPPLERLLARLLPLRALAIGRFAMVGASGLIVNQVLLWSLVSIGHLHYLLAAVLATQGSTSWNYALVEQWVFPQRKGRSRAFRYLTFSAINNATLLLRIPALVFLVSTLRVHYLLSNALTLLVLFFSRFVVSDRLIWKTPEVPATPAGHVVESTTLTRAGRDLTPQRRCPHRYDVGGLVTFESDVVLRELAYYAVPALGKPADISIRVGEVGDRGPRRRPVVTHGPEFVAYEEHLGRHGANFRLDFTDHIEVTVGPLLARSPHVVYTNVVEALLRFLLVSRGRMLLHSATVELDGRGVMLTARTDTGKTGTILRLLREHGAAFLSDDMTLVEPGGLAGAYPKPLTISSHTLAAVDSTVLSAAERRWLAVQSRVHSKSGRAVGGRLASLNLPIMALNAITQAVIPPPKYMVDRLVPCRHAEAVRVEELFVIERGPAALEEVDHEAAVEIMVRNTDDAYGFPPFRYFAPAISIGGEDYQTLRKRERELLSLFLRDVRVRRLVRDDFSWADTIPRLLAEDQGLAPRWPA
jgi:dolichol-phosphate mannosyltransferase